MVFDQELVDITLTTAGGPLLFDSGLVFGIAGFNFSILLKGEHSVYEVEVQNFSFVVSSKVCASLDITTEDIFTTSDNIYLYTFQVATPPTETLDGYSKLLVNFISKEAL